MSTHKAATRSLHWLLSCAAHPMVFQVYPVSFISVSTVPLGLPGLLFPGGAHFTDLLTILSSSLLSTCPRYLHLLRFIFILRSPMPVLSATSLLLTRSCHLTPRILLRHLPSKPLSLLSISLLVLHVSAAYACNSKNMHVIWVIFFRKMRSYLVLLNDSLDLETYCQSTNDLCQFCFKCVLFNFINFNLWLKLVIYRTFILNYCMLWNISPILVK